MFFDNLAGIVERHLPEFTARMQDARLFRIEPRAPSFSVGELVESWEPDQRTIENFRLPFPVVAFEEADRREESGGCCLVLSAKDAERRELEFLIGQGTRRETLVAAGTFLALPDIDQHITPTNYDRLGEVKSLRAWEGGKKAGVRPIDAFLHWIEPGIDRVDHLEGGDEMQRLMVKYHRNEPGWEEEFEQARDKCARYALRLQTNMVHMRCLVGVLELLIVNEPASFIVEERPVVPPSEPPTAVPRSAGRPHYVVLKPRQIRQRFLYPNGQPESDDDEEENGEHRKVTPHERRGHFRRLQSDRFKNARGAVLWIKPMWVGPSEAVKGKNRYRVMLEL